MRTCVEVIEFPEIAALLVCALVVTGVDCWLRLRPGHFLRALKQLPQFVEKRMRPVEITNRHAVRDQPPEAVAGQPDM